MEREERGDTGPESSTNERKEGQIRNTSERVAIALSDMAKESHSRQGKNMDPLMTSETRQIIEDTSRSFFKYAKDPTTVSPENFKELVGQFTEAVNGLRSMHSNQSQIIESSQSLRKFGTGFQNGVIGLRQLSEHLGPEAQGEVKKLVEVGEPKLTRLNQMISAATRYERGY